MRGRVNFDVPAPRDFVEIDASVATYIPDGEHRATEVHVLFEVDVIRITDASAGRRRLHRRVDGRARRRVRPARHAEPVVTRALAAIALVLAACGDNLEPSAPDAGELEVDAEVDAAIAVDAGDVDAAPDATPDAAPDAPASACWAIHMLSCAEGSYLVCVPIDGCTAPLICNGEELSFCGPNAAH